MEPLDFSVVSSHKGNLESTDAFFAHLVNVRALCSQSFSDFLQSCGVKLEERCLVSRVRMVNIGVIFHQEFDRGVHGLLILRDLEVNTDTERSSVLDVRCIEFYVQLVQEVLNDPKIWVAHDDVHGVLHSILLREL